MSANLSANITDEENCALWIMNLPRDCDIPMLLGSIRNCGKVFQVHINEPEPERGHVGCAAKLIFFHHEAAAKLMERSWAGDFHVGDRNPQIVWNRTRVPPRARSQDSRVLQITGPREIVNRNTLTELFESACEYQLESVEEPERVGGLGGLYETVFRFGSYRCQAEGCFQAIRGRRAAHVRRGNGAAAPHDDRMACLWEKVQVHWGIDPCV